MQATRGDPGLRTAAALLAWLAGTSLQLQQSALWPGWINAALLLLGLALAWAAMRRAAGWNTLLLCIALAAIAFGITSLRAGHRLAEQLAAPLEGRDLLLTGVVHQMPQVSPEGVRFVLAVESALRQPLERARAGSRVAGLAVRPGRRRLGSAALRPDLRAGQRWQVPVRLRRPHGAMNPHGFDGELWLFEQQIGATGTVRNTVAGPRPALLEDTNRRPIERARQALRDAAVLRVADARLGGVLAALTVGDQAAIARADWDLFRDSGVAHLMSISGLHITMFAWLAGALVAWGLAPQRARLPVAAGAAGRAMGRSRWSPRRTR